MSEEKVLLRIQDNVAVVTLNAPEVLNALSVEMVRQLSVAVSKAAKTKGVAIPHDSDLAELRPKNGISGYEQ